MTSGRDNEDRVRRLWERYWKSGKNWIIRNELVEHYYPLIAPLTSRLHRRLPRRTDLDIIESAAGRGLIEAVERFDPQQSSDFPCYAHLVIRSRIANDLKREYRILMRSRRLDHRQLEEEAERSRSTSCLRQQTFRPAVLRSFAESNRQCFAEEMPASRSDEPESSAAAHDAAVSEAYQALPPRAKAILYLHFLECVSQADIAGIFGISRVRVTQIIRQSLDRLTC